MCLKKPRVFSEAPVTTRQASSSGLALSILSNAYRQHTYVLYDAGRVKDTWTEFVDDNVIDPDAWSSTILNNVYATLTTSGVQKKKQWGASEIRSSAAESGYGPLIYDIAMALESGLISDRDSVSPAARKVWNFYKNNRKDVEIKKLDDLDNPKTSSTFDDAIVFDDNDDANPLNYAYFINKSPNVSSLQSNDKKIRTYHEKASKKLNLGPSTDFDLMMQMSSSEFFMLKYGR
jgi:hypothetical protein